jgi:hypothetical protein
MKLWILLLLCVTGGVILSQESSSPDTQVRTRQLWDSSLVAQRPAAPAAAPKPTVATPANPTVRGLVGVTLWRLRPAHTTDRREIRALIQEDGRDLGDWTPERIPADSPILEGQRLRISVESGEEGYLYLVDRDEYADGTKSDPYLIFPTTRTRGGDNHVRPGVVIQIPDAGDNPNYFKVERSRADQVNEVVTILVSPKPIPGIGNTPNRVKLREEQMAEWEKQSKTKAYRLEALGGAGKVLTVAEQEASRGGVLTQADPLPQTMYRVDAKPGDTIMLRLPLKITPNAAK